VAKKNILAINTTLETCTVIIAKNSTILAKDEVIASKGHSEILLPLISKSLKSSNLDITQIDGFAVCTGPGNYTSLRIAISTIRGLSLSCNKPVVGISLFEILMTNHYKGLVIIKGPMEKIYVQEFSNNFLVGVPKLKSVADIKKNNKFLEHAIIGYDAIRIADELGCLDSLEVTKISPDRFILLSLERFSYDNPRPAPIYIK